MDRFKFSAMAAMALLAAGALAYGQSFSITKIADTNTPIPGGEGDFTGFGELSGGAFVGEGGGGQDGVYLFEPGYPVNNGAVALGLVANVGMAAVGFPSGVDFANFSSVSFGEEGISFIATTNTGAQAVYDEWSGSGPTALILIAQTGQNPSAGVTFNNFTSVSSTYQDNEPLNPTGEFLSDAGIYYFSVSSGPEYPPYSSSYTVSFTQEATTAAPSAFSILGQPNFKAGFPDGARLGDSTIQTMRASVGSVEGIYYSPPNGPSSGPAPFAKLVDTTTPTPNGAGDFSSFGNPVANDSYIVFTAQYDNGNQQGIFAWGSYFYSPFDGQSGPVLTELVASGAMASGSNGAHFENFLGVTATGTFLAELDNGTEGIYHLVSGSDGDFTGAISDIIDTTDTLNGKTIASFELFPESDYLYAGTSFIVNFTDGSQGLYFETGFVPEPALAWLVGFPVLLMDRRRR